MFWSAPIQMAICLILLLLNLGPSALAGFAFFIIVTPLQTQTMKQLFRLRQKSMVWTGSHNAAISVICILTGTNIDKRAKLLQELLGGMKVIKFFTWEIPFLNRIAEYRSREIQLVSVFRSNENVLIIY